MNARPDNVQRLDWFAANAPEMPDWFTARVVYPEYDGPPPASNAYPIELVAQASKAMAKKLPMPAGAEDYLDRRTLYVEASKLHAMARLEAEFVQWRTYYAQLMVAAMPAYVARKFGDTVPDNVG